jgi:D-3-phosphoglycerate dehydrogenase
MNLPKANHHNDIVVGKGLYMMSKKWRVLIGSRSFGQMFPEHLQALEESGCEVIPNGVGGRAYLEAELIDAITGVDAIVTGTDEITSRVIAVADQLKTIAKHGVGLETIDLNAAKARGIVVSYTPGAIHDSVADLTMGLLLAVARRIVYGDTTTRHGQWKTFFGMELRDKVMGLVGLGRIGKAVALRAKAFGMSVIAVDPYPDAIFATEHGVRYVTLEELLATADIVSLHAAAEQIKGVLIGANELQQMKPGSVLINTARGVLVDEAALCDALKSGHLFGAGIDAFVMEPPTHSPLLTLENVVLAPHAGGRTREGQRRQGELCLENCLRALRGETPLFTVP